MKYTKMVEAIVEHVGGKSNISVATHCMTRLRLNLEDSSKVDAEALKKLDGVLGVVDKGQQTQIVIGPSVNEVYAEFVEYTGMKEEKPVEENLDDLKQDLKNRKGNLLIQSHCTGIGWRRSGTGYFDDCGSMRFG